MEGPPGALVNTVPHIGPAATPGRRAFSEALGAIPRAVRDIFATLDSLDSEYTVRVSNLEVYNEELHDLLSADKSGAKELRLFERRQKDATSNDTETVVHNLEEFAVSSPDEVLELLAQSIARRSVAETFLNSRSSRSHSIFTIHTHVKEATAAGEELLKVGKLNLVDLAGSENIGRSGATHDRAREAGRINKSLLTLGRVINALVERLAHVPYRESKLTRILQDSLGGHTKTCIVATVSPALSCADETLSTLNYMQRAKTIKNRPTLNQRLTKRLVIAEYVTEIERLQRELRAAREKNGVFLAPGDFAEMNRSLEAQREAIAGLEAELERTLGEFTRVQELFRVSEEELATARARALEAERMYAEEQRGHALASLDAAEHAHTEEQVRGRAEALMGRLKSSLGAVGRLMERLDEGRDAERETFARLEGFARGVRRDLVKGPARLTEEVEATATAALDRCAAETRGCAADTRDGASTATGRLDQLVETLGDASSAVCADFEKRVAMVMDAATEGFERDVFGVLDEFGDTTGRLRDEISSAFTKSAEFVSTTLMSEVAQMRTDADSRCNELERDFASFVDGAAQQLQRVQAQFVALAKHVDEHAQGEAAAAQRLAAQQRQANEEFAERLETALLGVLGGFSTELQMNMAEFTGDFEREVGEVDARQLPLLEKKCEAITDGTVEAIEELRDAQEKQLSILREAIDGEFRALSQAARKFTDELNGKKLSAIMEFHSDAADRVFAASSAARRELEQLTEALAAVSGADAPNGLQARLDARVAGPAQCTTEQEIIPALRSTLVDRAARARDETEGVTAAAKGAVAAAEAQLRKTLSEVSAQLEHALVTTGARASGADEQPILRPALPKTGETPVLRRLGAREDPRLAQMLTPSALPVSRAEEELLQHLRENFGAESPSQLLEYIRGLEDNPKWASTPTAADAAPRAFPASPLSSFAETPHNPHE